MSCLLLFKIFLQHCHDDIKTFKKRMLLLNYYMTNKMG